MTRWSQQWMTAPGWTIAGIDPALRSANAACGVRRIVYNPASNGQGWRLHADRATVTHLVRRRVAISPGGDDAFTLIELTGSADGPTLSVVGGVHGDEFEGGLPRASGRHRGPRDPRLPSARPGGARGRPSSQPPVVADRRPEPRQNLPG